MKVKYIPTWKIREILDEPYCRGVDGKDYEPWKDELEQELWDRENKEVESEIAGYIKALKTIPDELKLDYLIEDMERDGADYETLIEGYKLLLKIKSQ